MSIKTRLKSIENQINPGDGPLWNGIGHGIAPGRPGNLLARFCEETFGYVDPGNPDAGIRCEHWDTDPPSPGITRLGAYVILSSVGSMLTSHNPEWRSDYCKLLGITEEQAEDHELVDRRRIEIATEMGFTTAELRRLKKNMRGDCDRAKRNRHF